MKSDRFASDSVCDVMAHFHAPLRTEKKSNCRGGCDENLVCFEHKHLIKQAILMGNRCTVHRLFLKPEWWVTTRSVLTEKQIQTGWGPGRGGWEAGGGGWAPEVDAAGLPLPRTPTSWQKPCSHSDRGGSEEGKNNTATINWYADLSQPIFWLIPRRGTNQLVTWAEFAPVLLPGIALYTLPFCALREPTRFITTTIYSGNPIRARVWMRTYINTSCVSQHGSVF